MILTGGVVFNILTKYKARTVTSRQQIKGVKSGNTEPEMMEALVKAIDPGTETNLTSLKSNTSDYKNCDKDGTKNIPFNKPDVISDYRNLVEQDYNRAVHRMKEFTDSYINRNNEQRSKLVSHLITAIQLDQTIREEPFYVQPSGEAIKKQDLVQIKEIPLETLLVGLMYFVLTQRSGRNDKGQDMLKFMETGEYKRLYVQCIDWVEEENENPQESEKTEKLPSRKKVVENMSSMLQTLAGYTGETGVNDDMLRQSAQAMADTIGGMFEKDDESEKREEKVAEPEVVEVVEPMKDDKGNTFINNGSGPQIGTVNGDFNYYYPGGDRDGK